MAYQQTPNQLDSPGPSSADDGVNSSTSNEDNSGTNKDITHTYYKSGLSRSLHGTIFQLEALVQCAYRGLKEYAVFQLATEMDEAEKFDDAVIMFKVNEKDPGWTIRFFQFKHKQDPDNKITVNELKTETDGPFSILKYFISFINIKENPEFKKHNLEDFIICTNTSFQFDDNFSTTASRKRNAEIKSKEELKWKKYFIHDKDFQNDKILFFDKTEFAANKYRFAPDAEGDLKKMIKPSLIKKALECKQIKSKEWAEKKIKSSKILHFGNMIKNIHDAIKDMTGPPKTVLLRETKQILKLKDIINTTDFNTAYDNLKNTQASEKKDQKKKYILDNAISNVLKEARKVDKEANEELLEAKNTMDKFQKKDSPEYKNLEHDTNKLNTILKCYKKFKNTLEEETLNVQNMTEIAKKCDNESGSGKLFEYIKSKTTEEGIKESLCKKLQKEIAEIYIIKVALEHEQFDTYMKDFIEKFRIVTNYPNVDQLKILIAEEIGVTFDLKNADLPLDSFLNKVLDWFKQKHGEFLSKNRVSHFKTSIEAQVNSLRTAGITTAFVEKVNSFRISFEPNLIKFQNSLEDFWSSQDQVFQVDSQFVQFSTVKILQCLKKRKEFNYYDSYICISLELLVNPEIQRFVISTFDSKKNANLLVIECPFKAEEKKEEQLKQVEELYKLLREVLGKWTTKKIIFIYEDTFLSNFRTFNNYKPSRDDTNFIDLDTASQNLVLDKEIDFQGKNVKLHSLMDNKWAQKNIIAKDLMVLLTENEIKTETENVFLFVGNVGEYYIPRCFGRQQVSPEVLNLNDENAKKIGCRVVSSNTTTKPECDSNVKFLDESKNFKKFFDEFPKVNLFDFQNGILTWTAVKGSTSELRKYLNETQKYYSENSFKEGYFTLPQGLQEKVVILASDPGTGKSTVLTSLANKFHQLHDEILWIVRINLHDYTDESKNNNLGNISNNYDIDKAIDLVTGMVLPDSNLQRNLFKAVLKSDLKSSLQIVMFIDGFDEISPKYKEKSTKLIKLLQKSNFLQIWVTTRVHEKCHLEDELQAPAYILYPLDDNEQISFLTQFWKCNLQFYDKTSKELIECLKNIQESLKLNCNSSTEQNHISNIIDNQINENFESLQKSVNDLDFSNYAKILLVQFKQSIKDSKRTFTNIPLHLRMLAEVIFRNSFKLPKHFQLLDLYYDFVNMKFNIHYKVKAEMIKNLPEEICKRDKESMYTYHQLLATKLLEETLLDGSDRDRISEIDKPELARIGLVVLKNNNNPEFIHRSFAEYFFSEYLIKYWNQKRIQILLTEKILVQDDFIVVRLFLNSQIKLYYTYKEHANNSSLEKEIMEPKQKDLENLSNKLQPDTNNSIKSLVKTNKSIFIHKLAEEGHSTVIKFLLEQLENFPDTLKEIVTATNTNKETFLHIAGEKHIEYIETVLNCLESQPSILKHMLDMKHKSDLTILQWAVCEGNVKLVSILLNFIRKMFPEIVLSYIDLEGNARVTLLDIAVQKDYSDIVKCILEFIVSNKKIFHDKYDGFLKELVTKRWPYMHPLMDVIRPNILEVASERGYDKTVTSLLNGLKNEPEILKEMMLHNDNNNINAFDVAVRMKKFDTIELFLNYFRNDNTMLKAILLKPDEEYNIPLHHAALTGCKKIFETLLNWVKEKYPSILKQMILKKDENGNNCFYKCVSKIVLIDILFPFITETFPDESSIILKKLFWDVNIEYETAFHEAIRNKSTIVRKILELFETNIAQDCYKEFFELCNDQRRNFLHLASLEDDNETLNILISFIKSKIENNCPGILKNMLQKLDTQNYTPLQLAAGRRYWLNVFTLLKSGANVHKLTENESKEFRDYLQSNRHNLEGAQDILQELLVQKMETS